MSFRIGIVLAASLAFMGCQDNPTATAGGDGFSKVNPRDSILFDLKTANAMFGVDTYNYTQSEATYTYELSPMEADKLQKADLTLFKIDSISFGSTFIPRFFIKTKYPPTGWSVYIQDLGFHLTSDVDSTDWQVRITELGSPRYFLPELVQTQEFQRDVTADFAYYPGKGFYNWNKTLLAQAAFIEGKIRIYYW